MSRPVKKTGSKPPTKKARKAPIATRDGAQTRETRRPKSRAEEPTSQVTLKMRASQHRQLARLAFNADTTMRGFIMEALKAKGLKVTRQDLVDRRRK